MAGFFLPVRQAYSADTMIGGGLNMAMKRVGLFTAALLIVALTAQAQTIYQGKDANGKPVFTDQPRPGDKAIELPPINTTPATQGLPAAPVQPAAFGGYTRVALAVAGSVPNAYAPVTVGIEVVPELQSGHLWQLTLDGHTVAAGRESSYSFAQLERGDHVLSLQIIDQGGQVVAESAPASVFVQFPKGKK